MITWTYGEARAKVELDLDLQNETNITPDEMVGYFNEAISYASAQILKIHEDYFEKSAPIDLIAGQSLYSLPSDIYAAKIRDLIYSVGALTYKVRRIRGQAKFLDYQMTQQYGTGMEYRYILQNVDAATGFQIVLSPASRETASGALTVWYIRNANKIPLVSSGDQAASDAALIDIPEFYTFIIQYVKVKCLQKDGADPRLPENMTLLDEERTNMIDTLTQMVPDDDDNIIPDFTHYTEHE